MSHFGHQLHRPSAFFRESDEGTETILPSLDIQHSMRFFHEVTSLFEKYVIYIAAFRSRAHQNQFGLQSFKLLTDTTTPARVDQIIQRLGARLMAPPLSIHSDFILHTDRQTLARFDNNPYHPDHYFKNLKGQPVHLLEV